MQENLLNFLREHQSWAIIISLALSVLVAVMGILPSYFITAANVLFFGFWPGTLLSFMGEAVGAAVAFLLYRKGFQKKLQNKLSNYPKLNYLMQAKGSKAFYLVFITRIIPFIPSGLVSFGAAMSSMGLLAFIISSSLGKIPSLILEAYSVKAVTDFNWQGKLILLAFALIALYFLFRNTKKSAGPQDL